jgi:hypothetical protein
MTGGDVNYAQSAVAQSDSSVYEDAFVVWSPMSNDISHALKRHRVDDSPRFAGKGYTVYATHTIVGSGSRLPRPIRKRERKLPIPCAGFQLQRFLYPSSDEIIIWPIELNNLAT